MRHVWALVTLLFSACATLPQTLGPAWPSPAGSISATVTPTVTGTQITLTFTNTSSAPIYFTDHAINPPPGQNLPPYIYFDQGDGILILWALPQPTEFEQEAGTYRIQRLNPGEQLTRSILLPPKLYEARASGLPVPRTAQQAQETIYLASYRDEKTIRRFRVAVGYFSQEVIEAHHHAERDRFPRETLPPDVIYKNGPVPLADLKSPDFTRAALASILRSDEVTAISCPWDCQAFSFSPEYPLPEQKILLYDPTHGTNK